MPCVLVWHRILLEDHADRRTCVLLAWIGQWLPLVVTMHVGVEARMRLTRFTVTVLMAVCAAVAVARVTSAAERKAPVIIAAETQPAFSAAVRPPGRQVDSILTTRRGAVAGQKGTGWLLHSGTPHDACERADATSGLRMACLAW